MIAGIILHPVRLLMAWTNKKSFEWTIQRKVLHNWEEKNLERLHRFDEKDFPDTCSFSCSELSGNLFRGALDR